MAHNLRRKVIDGEVYVNILDVFKVIEGVAVMEGLHPEAVKALDGFGTGLALVTGMADMGDLPEEFKQRLGVSSG